MKAWSVQIDQTPAGQVPWPARVSVPIARGACPAAFVVQGPDGRAVPAQHRTLVAWPDGTPRWVQLDFPARAPGVHRVLAAAEAPAAPSELSFTRTGDAFAVACGRLHVSLTPLAPAPLRTIRLGDATLCSEAAPWSFVAVDESGRECPASEGRDIRVEAAGPQRLQLSWEADHLASPRQALLRIRYRIEFLAGVEGFTLSYQFFHVLPGHPFLTLKRLAARFPFAGLAGESGRALAVQSSHGLTGAQRVAAVPHPVTIHMDRTSATPYVRSLEEFADDFEYPYFLRQHAFGAGAAVGLAGPSGSVLWTMEDFTHQRPKQLRVEPGAIEIDLWPESAGPLVLPQGRSKAQRFSFRFFDSPAGAQEALAVPARHAVRPALGWLDPADSTDAGPSWDAARLFAGGKVSESVYAHILTSATARLSTVGEVFHFGDTPHPGYTTSYAGGVGYPSRFGPRPELPFTQSGVVDTRLFPEADLRPVWANNEYDAIYCLALEAIRTRGAAAWEKLRPFARHAIEVDFVHYSDHWQHHHGTPCHTYDHVLCSTAYPSHQWTQGLYYYYCISGDDDVPEVVRAICDTNIRWLERPELAFMLSFNRELGWGALALVFGYELTADPRYIAKAAELFRILERAARGDEPPGVHLRGAARLLGANFTINTVPLAIRAYYAATGEDWARRLLVEWVDAGIPSYNRRSDGPKLHDLFPESMAAVHELSGDHRYVLDTLWHLHLFMLGYGPTGWTGAAANQPIDAKLYGRVYRGLVHYLAACERAGVLEQAEAALLAMRSCLPGAPPA